jgi:MFS family permease
VSPPTRWPVLLLLCAAFFVVVTDSTLVYAALPSMAREFALSHTGAQWIVTAYLLTFGGLLLLGGRIADLGRRVGVFTGGCALFTAASLLAGMAWAGPVLIGARLVQGAAAAVMVPAALSLLTTTFPEGEQRNRALGVWGALAGLGATAGLLLGGPITQALGWRWVFLVNVPMGLLVVAFAASILPRSRRASRPSSRLNVGSASLATLTLAALLYAMVGAPATGRGHGLTWVTLGAVLVLAVLFILSERRSPDPLLPVRVLASRTRIGGNLVILSAGMSVDGVLYGFTLLTQDVLDYSPSRFGVLAAAMTTASFFGIGTAQRLTSRFGARVVATPALMLISVGAALLARAPHHSDPAPLLLGSMVILGTGIGAAFVVGQIAALAGVTAQDAGIAAGIEESTFTIGNALGIALVAALVAANASLATGLRHGLHAVAVISSLGGLAALALIGRAMGAHEAPGTSQVQESGTRQHHEGEPHGHASTG